MIRIRSFLALPLVLAGCAPPAAVAPAPLPAEAAATARPIPYAVMPPPEFRAAVASGTRTMMGRPGPRYWQQRASYRIRVRVDAAAKQLTGAERIVYRNNSPDTLNALYLHLFQNLHAPGAVRNEEAEVTGGVKLARVAARGEVLAPAEGEAPGWRVDGTRLRVTPRQPLLPGDSIPLDLDWSFTIPQAGAGGRMGYSRDDLFYLAYFYPQMAVYDDVVGWQTDPFLSGAEFYLGYGDYDLSIDAPVGWTVISTGELTNPMEVMPAAVIERIRRAEASDSIVTVLGENDFGAGRATLPGSNGRLLWRYRAANVRDVAFSMTRRSRWDAARTNVGDRNGDGRADYARVDALWRATAPRWANVARYAQDAVAQHSRFTGVSYPWSHMTVVEGEDIIGGGMEFPMMTLIGPYTQRSDTALYSVTSHEIAHMWFPMIVGVDETRYGWMDEGTTEFNANESVANRYAKPDARRASQERYLALVRRGIDAEVLRWTNYQYPGPYGTFATYYKPSANLATLRALLGTARFDPAYKAYTRAWAFRQPKPWDFFNAFNAAAGQDLGWFWRSWYDETWTLDQAVASVSASPDGGAVITVADRGEVPMPARVTITRANGAVERMEVPVATWLSGARTATLRAGAGPPVARVEIDAAREFPDVDRSNNVWTR